MIPEKVFQKILVLGDGWRVQQVDYVEQESKVRIRIEETPALWRSESCPHCAGKSVSCYDHAPERTWRHLNVCQLESEIVCALPRGRCKGCQKVYTVRAPWEGRSRGLTQEFEAFALTLMREMPVSKAGEILGETDQKLWRALFAHVDAAWAALSWENVVWVGADEMNRKKGHNYLTVFVDLEAKRVLLAVEGKDASTWERFAEQLGQHNGHPKAIRQVAIDMSPAYIKGVKENFGNAVIVYDKFHVVSQVGAAVEAVRRKEARQDAVAREHLEKTCWLWRKNPESWTEREERRWEQLKDKPLVTGLAYAMRLELQRAYASASAKVARSRFVNWCRWVRTEAEAVTDGLLEPMRKAAEMVELNMPRHASLLQAQFELIDSSNLYAYLDNNPANEIDPLGLLTPSNPTCQALKRKIENLEKEIRDRTRELYEDPRGLPGTAAGDDVKPSLSRRGHQKILNMMKANLAAKKALYQATCNDPEPPQSCPLIQPMFGGQPISPGQAALGLGVAAGGAVMIGAPEAAPVLIPVFAP